MPKPPRVIKKRLKEQLVLDALRTQKDAGFTRVRPIEDRVIPRGPAVASLKLAVRDRGLKMQSLPFTLLALLFILIIFLQRSVHDSFLVERTVRVHVVDTGFSSVTDIDSAMGWISDTLVPTFFQSSWYEGTPLTDAEYTNNTLLYSNHLIGGVRLLQRRVKEGTCDKSKKFESFVPLCWGNLRASTEDTEPFGPPNDPTRYVHESDHHGITGYFVDLPLNAATAQSIVTQLKLDRWIDRATREVVVDFTLWNHNLNLFTLASLRFEVESSGFVLPSVDIHSAVLEPYLSKTDNFRLFLEIVFVLLLFGMFFSEIIALVGHMKQGVGIFMLYHGNIWTIIRFLNYALGISAVSVWIAVQNHDIKRNLVLPQTRYIDMTPLSVYFKAYEGINAVNILIYIIRIFELTQFDPKVSFMTDTVKAAWGPLKTFFVFFFIVFFAFVAMGMHLFGHSLLEWSSFTNASNTAFQLTTGEYPYATLLEVDPYIASIFYYSFMILVFLILINMFLAIVADAYLNLMQQNRSENALRSAFSFKDELIEWKSALRDPDMDWWTPSVGLVLLNRADSGKEELHLSDLEDAADRAFGVPKKTAWQFLARYGVDPRDKSGHGTELTPVLPSATENGEEAAAPSNLHKLLPVSKIEDQFQKLEGLLAKGVLDSKALAQARAALLATPNRNLQGVKVENGGPSFVRKPDEVGNQEGPEDIDEEVLEIEQAVSDLPHLKVDE